MPWLIGASIAGGIGSYFLTELNKSARYALIGSGAYLAYYLTKGK